MRWDGGRAQLHDEANNMETPLKKLKVGDAVIKPDGYKFPGVVRSVFENHRGDIRIVVEFNGDSGLLHIFSENQVERTEYVRTT